MSAQMADMVGAVVETVGEEPEPESEDVPEPHEEEEEEVTKVRLSSRLSQLVLMIKDNEPTAMATIPLTHPFLSQQVEEVTLTLEPEPCSLTPSPLREEAPSTRGSSPGGGAPAQTADSAPQRKPFDVTPCVVQSLEEKDEEAAAAAAEDGSIVVVATN